MNKDRFIEIIKKHKFMVIALCWTPAWACIACIIGQGDVKFILINLAMCWTGFCMSALATHLVHKWEEEKHEKDKE